MSKVGKISTKIYITCISNPGLNEFFRSNKVLLIEEDSVWGATLEILHETGDYLKTKVEPQSQKTFKVYGFIDEIKTMVIYDATITFEKSKTYIQRGDWEIPKDSILQSIFPTEIEHDFTVELGESIEIKDGKYPD